MELSLSKEASSRTDTSQCPGVTAIIRYAGKNVNKKAEESTVLRAVTKKRLGRYRRLRRHSACCSEM
jgi:hypothetical protein